MLALLNPHATASGRPGLSQREDVPCVVKRGVGWRWVGARCPERGGNRDWSLDGTQRRLSCSLDLLTSLWLGEPEPRESRGGVLFCILFPVQNNYRIIAFRSLWPMKRCQQRRAHIQRALAYLRQGVTGAQRCMYEVCGVTARLRCRGYGGEIRHGETRRDEGCAEVVAAMGQPTIVSTDTLTH